MQVLEYQEDADSIDFESMEVLKYDNPDGRDGRWRTGIHRGAVNEDAFGNLRPPVAYINMDKDVLVYATPDRSDIGVLKNKSPERSISLPFEEIDPSLSPYLYGFSEDMYQFRQNVMELSDDQINSVFQDLDINLGYESNLVPPALSIMRSPIDDDVGLPGNMAGPCPMPFDQSMGQGSAELINSISIDPPEGALNINSVFYEVQKPDKIKTAKERLIEETGEEWLLELLHD